MIGLEGWYRDQVRTKDAEIEWVRAENEHLRTDRAVVYAWMREPDHVENASLEWFTDWINRRPLDRALEQSALPTAADVKGILRDDWKPLRHRDDRSGKDPE
jgi:hypothetical protein